MSRNKRGQVGETLTWIIAILAILIMMILFIYMASLMVKAKGTLFGGYTGKYFLDKSNIDLFARQSVISLLNTPENSNTIYGNLKSTGDFNGNSGSLAYKIFNGLYGSYYTGGIFLGVSDSPLQVDTAGNKYFKAPTTINPGQIGTGPVALGQAKVSYYINFTNGKYFDAIVAGGGQK